MRCRGAVNSIPFLTISDLFILSRGTVYLPSEFQNLSTAGIRPLEKWKPYDRHTIAQALKETGWNKAKAARLLGIGRRTIYLKIKEYDITEIQ